MARQPDIESEIKIPVDDLDPVRQRLRDGGWSLHRTLHRERNVLFDTADDALRDGDMALRLRHTANGWTVTFKGPAVIDGGVKSREELEIEIDDGTAFVAIMLRLGYTPSLRYEKDRETWREGDLLVSLDHTPIGDFVEIEGPERQIGDIATRLDLDPRHALAHSYPALWEAYRRDHGDVILPEHMTFGAV